MDTNTRARGCAIIVAGGSGTRFGNPGGKLLIDVAGKPLITWTLEAFDAASRVERIVVVCPPEKTDEMHRAAVAPFGFATPIAFAPSGAERQDSTRNGLDSVPTGCDIVLVHDAARPLILPETIDAAIDALVSADQAPAFGDPGGTFLANASLEQTAHSMVMRPVRLGARTHRLAPYLPPMTFMHSMASCAASPRSIPSRSSMQEGVLSKLLLALNSGRSRPRRCSGPIPCAARMSGPIARALWALMIRPWSRAWAAVCAASRLLATTSR